MHQNWRKNVDEPNNQHLIVNYLKQIKWLSKDVQIDFRVNGTWNKAWWRRNHLEIKTNTQLKRL